jgi:hypothetical protein
VLYSSRRPGRQCSPRRLTGELLHADPHRAGRRDQPSRSGKHKKHGMNLQVIAGQAAVMDLYAICTCPASRLHARELRCCDKSQGSQGESAASMA